MTDRQDVLQAALRLSAEERAAIAVEIIASIDGAPDADADRTWSAEIEERARQALAGSTEGTDWGIVRERIERKLDS